MSHLAQINIGRILAPMDSPTMAGFRERLDEINALADGYPGFVWRLQEADGNATSLRPYEDEWLLINMSVWESIETLREYTYETAHAEVMRGRRQWFEPHTEMYYAMWWVPEGHIPTIEEAQERLGYMQANGESEYAFTFKYVKQNPKAAKEAGKTG